MSLGNSDASVALFSLILAPFIRICSMQTLQQTTEPSITTLKGLESETDLIGQYFALFNLGRFQQVSQLFSDTGHLYPPFETPVVGPEAIATYLTKEADGMEAEPLGAESKPSDNDCVKITVWGKVTALVFNVKVAWEFEIAPTQKIQSVRVNLLASLGELLNLRSA